MDNTDNNSNKYKNYCDESGDILNLDKNIKLEKLEDGVCITCDSINNKESNYCKNCGTELYKLKDKKQFENIKDKKKSINEILDNFNIRKILLTSSLSVGILLIISFIIKVFISINLPEIAYIINPIHIAMALNLGSLNGYSSTMVGSGSIEAHIGVLALLIVPVVSIVISNLVVIKKEGKGLKEVILHALGVGISYGIMLAIISIFATIKSNPSDVINYGVSASFKFEFSSLLINGFIIGAFTTFMISFKKSHKDKNIYIDTFKSAIKTVAIGYILVFLLLTILIISDPSFLNEIGLYGYIGKFNIGVILSQLAAYIWEFSNFISININNHIISILSIGNKDVFLNTKLIFYAMTTLSLLVLLISGCNLKNKYKEDGKRRVLIFALSYAFIMGILAMFSTITLGGNISLFDMNNYQASIFMGTNITSTVIISFIYSYVVSFIGYRLNTF